MNKSMRPSAAAQRPLTEEEKKSQFMRAYMQKKASLAEGILYNLCQNPSLGNEYVIGGNKLVEAADAMATHFMKVVYHQEITIKDEE